MRTVRSQSSLLAVMLTVVCALAVALPGIASAGGPTSVLLASPYTDSSAALYYTDDDYPRLQGLLGGPDLPAGAADAPPASAAGSPYVTATWLIHDVSVWRIDRIFLVGHDIWVVSETSAGDGSVTGEGMFPGEVGNASAVWHRSIDPVELTALLTDHGLTPGAIRPEPDPVPAAQAAEPPILPASAAPSPSVWLWSIGGLLAGLVIGGALARTAATRRASSGPTGPTGEPARMLPIP